MQRRCSLINRRMRRWGLVALIGLALLPSRLLAQGYELRVTLHDTAGQGIVGVSIVLLTEEGQELAREATAADGSAGFASLPAVVRVGVEGQLRGGPPLFQLGDDANGVRLALDLAVAPAVLNLRAERDGLVLPDPTTMIAREEGGPVVEAAEPLPTALIATPAPLPTTQAVDAGATVVVGGQPREDTRHRAGWAPIVSVLIVILAAAMMLFIRRWRASR